METFHAFLKDVTFNVKLLWILFGQLLEVIGLHFIPTSGHTDSKFALLQD